MNQIKRGNCATRLFDFMECEGPLDVSRKPQAETVDLILIFIGI